MEQIKNHAPNSATLQEKYMRLSVEHFRIALERAKLNLINTETNRDAYALAGISDPLIEHEFSVAFNWLYFLTEVQINRNATALASVSRNSSAALN